VVVVAQIGALEVERSRPIVGLADGRAKQCARTRRLLF
jgi:hypothetical protein